MTTKRFNYIMFDGFEDNGEYITHHDVANLLNEFYEENEQLKLTTKELIRFIKCKGYTLQDYIKFIGQFQSVGVNKEDWE